MLPATFIVSAKISPNEPVNVRYNLAESEDFIDDEGNYKTTALDFSNGVKEAMLSVNIVNDTELENDGTITLTLIADSASSIAYSVASAPDHEAQVTVYDDDSPPKVWIAADSGGFAEGPTEAPFNLSATGLTGTTLIYINATPTEQGSDFLKDSRQGSRQIYEVTFEDSDGDNTFSGELGEPLDNDSIGEATGDIKMTLGADQEQTPTYRLGSTTEGVLTIWDDDAPELEITAENSVTEAVGAMATFTIAAKVIPSAPITVQYSLTETQDFIATADKGSDKSTSLDFAGTKMFTFPIDIINDNSIESNGMVTLTLFADIADPITYTVAPSPNNAATINLINDDFPVLSVSVGDPILEADNAMAVFTITTSISPNNYIFADYNLTESSDFINREGDELTAVLDFTNGSTTHPVSFPIISDDITEDDGTITLTLIEDTSDPIIYKVAAAPNNSKSLTVIDDDSLPVVSINAENGGVLENAGPAVFNLTATGLTTSTTFMINATPKEDGGDFIKDVYETATDFSVTFTDSDGDEIYTGELTLAVVDEQSMQVNLLKNNDDSGATGNIKLELNAGSTSYRLGSTTEGSIDVWDDETPELHVSADHTITEGDNVTAQFIIANTFSPNSRFMLHFDLAESGGDFITEDALNKTTEVNFESSARDYTLSFTLTNDDVEEANGTITLTINPDTTGEVDYTVDPADNSGTITVIDDDSLPEISIVADNGGIAENEGPAMFSLTTTDLSADETLVINATPDENGEDFLTNTVAGRAQDFSVDFTDPDGDSTYTGTIEIDLDNDTTGEATGDIKLTLNADPSAGKTYQLGSTTEGTINIYDDDAPTLKIRASSPNFVEGSNATADFIVSTEASPNKPVEIQYDVTETQSFVDSADKGMGKTASLDFSNNAKQATISVDIAEDTDTEVNGTITVTLKAHSTNTNTYMVATSPDDAATANVKDDDTLPVISIKADSGEAVEGPLAVPFKLTATGITGQQRILVIKATPSEVSDDFLRDQDENVLAQSQVTFTDPDGDGTYEANYTQRLHNDRLVKFLVISN